jgi:monofunctional biosynthetic peptidoglycan transglycosylase
MLQQWITGQSISQKWVAIEDMSPNIVRAVVLSEDGRFCQHSGIDFEALEDAVERVGGGSAARGASTISMQVVKNMFLWRSKSYLRKAIELPLTYVMELVWPKHRIMEVYLNIAEWGPGIFGVGAASEYHFRKSARNLSERDAARLAVALPNPLVRNAGKPGPGLQRLANAIQVRMRLAPSSQLACVLPKRRM